jgi:5'-nucleotidase
MKMIHYFLSACGICILVLSCSSKTNKSDAKNGELTIVYSGNIGAKRDVCGCRLPMGGLARRATVISNIRSTTPNLLILDSGALLYLKKNLFPPADYFHRVVARLMSDVINEIGIDAINVSGFDLADGPDTLLAYDRSTPVEWLSANLVWKKTGELIFQPDMIKTYGTMSVGIFGLIDQSSAGMKMFKDDTPMEILDPIETARREVSKLKEKCDLIIALGYMDNDRVNKLVDEVQGINILISSHTRDHSPSSDHVLFKPEKVGNTILLKCPDGGRVLGRLDLEIVNGSTDFKEITDRIDLRPDTVAESKQSHMESNYHHTFIDLVSSIPPNKEIQDKIKRVNAFVKDYMDLHEIK